jgi:hypothetical protein
VSGACAATGRLTLAMRRSPRRVFLLIGSATSILPVAPPAPKRSVSSTRRLTILARLAVVANSVRRAFPARNHARGHLQQRGRDVWPARNEVWEVADVDPQPLDRLERRRVPPSGFLR